jgi:hypothetical protein
MSAQEKLFGGCQAAEMFAASRDFAPACSALGMPAANRRPIVAMTPCALHQSLPTPAVQNYAEGGHIDRITLTQSSPPCFPEVYGPRPDSCVITRSLQASSDGVKTFWTAAKIACSGRIHLGPQGNPWTSFD